MEEEQFKRFEFQYGLVLVRTRRFQSLMDSLGSKRTTKPMSWVLLYFMPIAAAIGFYIFLSEWGILLSPRGAAVVSYIRTISPLANLGIPGINPYLPIVDGWIALIIAMVIHEAAHGVIARSLGIPVKSSGLLFFLFVPIGAFVDIDETVLKSAKASYAGRILAGGAGINLLLALVCLLLLLASVGTMVPAARGAGIINVGAGTPAFTAGIKQGDIITQVNGQNLTDLNSFFGPTTAFKAGEAVNLTVYRGGQILQFDNVVLACCDQIINTQTNVTISYPYVGVVQIAGADIAAIASQYASATNLYQFPPYWICIPTLPACQERVPFSQVLAPFYTSPLGQSTYQVTNLLYWIMFLNFNLAIFNSLPILPLDGGQAFRVLVRALGRGRLADRTVNGITGAATLGVVVMILGIVAGPYLL